MPILSLLAKKIISLWTWSLEHTSRLQLRGARRFSRRLMTDTEKNNLESELEQEAVVDSPNDSEAAETAMPEMDEAAVKQLEQMMQRLGRVDDLEREVGEWKTRFVRLQEDFENHRRRTAEDIKAAKTEGAASAIEALLGTYDDIARATDAGVKDPTTLIPGLNSVRENFLKNLEKYGAVMVAGKDAIFDPNVHEALQVVPGALDDVILEVFQAGFTLNGKLIRPARVIVSKQMN
jgi:molecular chaperone GrpE